jgi:hypothetical protein
MNARDELMLDSMGSTPNGFEIKTHAGGPQTAETLLFIADSMRATLDEYEAENYLEMEVKASDCKRYVMTLQRAGKITPHQARVKAEEALKAAQPRTITTAEELKTVYEGAVLRDVHGDMWSIDGASGRLFSIRDGVDDLYDDDELELPATVIYEASGE